MSVSSNAGSETRVGEWHLSMAELRVPLPGQPWAPLSLLQACCFGVSRSWLGSFTAEFAVVSRAVTLAKQPLVAQGVWRAQEAVVL